MCAWALTWVAGVACKESKAPERVQVPPPETRPAVSPQRPPVRESPVPTPMVETPLPRAAEAAEYVAANPTASKRLEAFLASPAHREVVAVVQGALEQLRTGRCEEAAKGAERVSAAIRKAMGGVGLSLEPAEMRNRLQGDPDFEDQALRSYKIRLFRISVALSWVPAIVADEKGTGKRRACERLRDELGAIRNPAAKP